MTSRRVDARQFGRESERLAERHLRGLGYAILERNVRLAEGEIDLVAKHGAVVVFVEVKARRTSAMGGAVFAVNGEKRHRLIRAAAQYLAVHRMDDQPSRIDVVIIQHVPSGEAIIDHLENAIEVPGHDLRW
ncbi:UPF0102 protein [Nitrospira sp.]|nr:UPF0102 protein [Nitrospira sp.]